MTNYEKYFGTSESAAESIAGANDFAESWNHWADNDGALICSLTPSRGNGKTKRQVEAFKAFLEADVKEPWPEWKRWVDGLDHDGRCKTTMDVIEQMAYEFIEHGGDMGPNGNVWEGVDEGMEMTRSMFESYERQLIESVSDYVDEVCLRPEETEACDKWTERTDSVERIALDLFVEAANSNGFVDDQHKMHLSAYADRLHALGLEVTRWTRTDAAVIAQNGAGTTNRKSRWRAAANSGRCESARRDCL